MRRRSAQTIGERRRQGRGKAVTAAAIGNHPVRPIAEFERQRAGMAHCRNPRQRRRPGIDDQHRLARRQPVIARPAPRTVDRMASSSRLRQPFERHRAHCGAAVPAADIAIAHRQPEQAGHQPRQRIGKQRRRALARGGAGGGGEQQQFGQRQRIAGSTRHHPAIGQHQRRQQRFKRRQCRRGAGLPTRNQHAGRI